MSPRSLRLWQTWLDNCLGCHPRCPRNIQNVLPTRVIDVGPPDGSAEPYLLTSTNRPDALPRKRASRRGTYIALSYYWRPQMQGHARNLTLTTSNLVALRAKIPFAELSKAIQDAVFITRQLKVRYLWIDALCILQGSDKVAREDWQSESGKTADVYGGAFLTIAAANASSAHDGFLHDKASSVEPTSIDVAFPRGSSDQSRAPISLRLGLLPPSIEYESSLAKEPLTRRGWALQEEQLSARVLFFSTKQFGWECQECQEHESGHHLQSAPSLKPTDSVLDRDSLLHAESERWRLTVTDYSSRALTESTDKLPALSGLARVHHQRMGKKYLADLWAETISSDLLWRVQVHQGSGNVRYRAPSWSWAFLDEPVQYGSPMYGESSVILQDSQIAPSGLDPFSEISSGWIRVRGSVQRVHHLTTGQELRMFCCNGDGDFLYVGVAHPDMLDDPAWNQEAPAGLSKLDGFS